MKLAITWAIVSSDHFVNGALKFQYVNEVIKAINPFYEYNLF